jgi:hypothetical protein
MLSIDEFADLWSSKLLTNEEVLNLVNNRGADIDITQASLNTLLVAANNGGRSSVEVSQVLVRLLRECLKCGDRFWAPFNEQDLRTMIKLSPPFALAGLKARGAHGLPITVDYIQSLVKAGATPEIVGEMEDRLEIPVPDGFTRMRLEKAADFSPLATQGKLTLHVDLGHQTVFLFRHNALYFKGELPGNLGCTYTGFGPADGDQTKWSQARQTQPPPKKPKGGHQPPVRLGSAVADESGRSGYQFTINNEDAKIRTEYTVELTWTR